MFDWMVSRADPKLSRNPAGFLLCSIRGECVPPREFLNRAADAQRAERQAERQRRLAERQRQREQEAQAKEHKRDVAIASFWSALTASERERLETEALAQATGLQQTLPVGQGSLAQTTRKTLLDAYALKLMQG